MQWRTYCREGVDRLPRLRVFAAARRSPLPAKQSPRRTSETSPSGPRPAQPRAPAPPANSQSAGNKQQTLFPSRSSNDGKPTPLMSIRPQAQQSEPKASQQGDVLFFFLDRFYRLLFGLILSTSGKRRKCVDSCLIILVRRRKLCVYRLKADVS